MPDTSPILTHAERVRRAMLRRNQRLLNQVTRDYLVAYRSLKTQIKTLAAAIAASDPTKGQLMRLAALQNLLEGTRKEIAKFTELLGERISVAVADEIRQAGVDTLTYVQLALPGFEEAGLMVNWIQLNPQQVYQMFGFLDEYGPLYASLKHQFTAAVVDIIRDTLLSGYIQGMNPREIARLISKAAGAPLNWALTMARTSSLWAYRSAAHVNYKNNSHVVKGWIWWAQLGDDRTCMSCISQHGSFHGLDEILADHHRGRCAPLPQTKTWEELGIEGVENVPFEVQRGEDWFRSLSPEEQRERMGPAKWQAWQDGKFDFSQLSKPYQDRIYGVMLREASLKDLLGEQVAKSYVQNRVIAR